ncbi:potassium/sodium efflux P-type ATPase, fungal-type [Paracoccidioides brasiliensis Pb18]|uniref:P-type Na(+) transporter n=1 Tax=Paracoccidioides brasiliensis (strain Pb18) TaxID=502780 RepID=C1GHD6_PARBD|nr:potassium/sodium efflux P-type ATPase, fungal-type [Paracoccidioides brasiliensis Pb18]EEH50593.1 potassium/sodium efflux P-type ATPase, fungal-type [Paracoccidioides brasiliensis Pb18]
MEKPPRRGAEAASTAGDEKSLLSLPAHCLPYDDVIRELRTDPEDGLTAEEAKRRLQIYGPNVLEGGERVSIGKILIRQLANAMMLVLIMAMVVSFGIQSWIEGGVVAAVVVLNVIVGFFQEFAAEKTMDSLRSLSSPTGNVSRNGNTTTIASIDIVPGDMVELRTGDTVPADLRLVEAVNFETDEALLTGESLPVHKDAEQAFHQDTGPGDRLNIAYSSSTVTRGRARGVVVATGMKTEIGSIAAALRASDSKVRAVKRGPDGETKKRWYVKAWALTGTDAVGRFLGVNVGTPLQRKLSKLALVLFGVAVVLAIIVMGSNEFSSKSEVIIYAVATGLSMIPACLVVVLTITMAVGTKRMVERNVIVRKLDSLEALGAVTNICSDKTGTLTQGKMLAKKAWIPSGGTFSVGTSTEPFNPEMGAVGFERAPPVKAGHNDEPIGISTVDLLKDNDCLVKFLDIASMANLAHVYKTEAGEWHARGEPTEIAIQVFASRFNWNRDRWTKGQDAIWHQVAEFPFDSSIKKMSVIFENPTQKDKMVFTKGAVERVLEACSTIVWNAEEGLIPISEDHRTQILENMEAIASQGLRVLALAGRKFTDSPLENEEYNRDDVERDLTFRGLIGLYDPPRPETAGAIEECFRAGISVHMVTGDHPGTARAIAAQVGIVPTDMSTLASDVSDAMVMTASQFDKLTDDEIDALPTLPLVIARCAPNTKVRMIQALHRRGRFCAMTGDGVNDSPSLKHADVGIAMGESGSDVAKDASDIILTDDNFASILNAIEEGRRIFDNIQKFVLHLLAENIAQACTLLIGLAFKDVDGQSVFPLAPVEILWIIMITSGMPDMGLGMEVAAPDIMDRPPQSKQGIFTREIITDTIFYGLWMAALCLASFTLVLYGFGDGNLGRFCNIEFSEQCETVFRARATTFVCLTWFALFLAWEMVNMRRSFFRMQPNSKKYFTQWMHDVWRNQFLFWAIICGFITIFPLLYIPVINTVVFKHKGITWEWGIVFVEATLFFMGVEAWKWGKRIYFRRQDRKAKASSGDLRIADVEQ